MHLRAASDVRVVVRELGFDSSLRSGETIHTESSHKFEVSEVIGLAMKAGFRRIACWKDEAWPFAEILFQLA